MTTLTVATLNLEDSLRLDLLPGLVGEVPGIDVLLYQEGRAFDTNGQALRFHAEELLAPLGLDRSFLTRSTRGVLHELVFINSARLRPLAHYTPDLPDVFHDQAGVVKVRAPGLGTPLVLKSVHWAYWSGDVRLDEAFKLTKYAAPGVAAILGGDCNSLFPDCPGHEPEREPDWLALPAHRRYHKALPPGLRPQGQVVADRRALSVLAEAGFTSAGCAAGDMTPTGQGGGRIDHILVSPQLAPAIVPGSYRVHTGPLAGQASDHRMVSVRLNLQHLKHPQAS